MLTRLEKQQQIDSLKESLIPAQGLFVMDFTGLSVTEVNELRRKVRDVEGQYVVVKNTLARLALAGSDNEPLSSLFAGPSAVAYTSRDAVVLAKALAEFAKGHDKLRFRGGLVEGELLDAEQAAKIATLPTKPELVARLLYLMQSPMRRLVTALNWPVRGLAVTLKQIAEEKERQA